MATILLRPGKGFIKDPGTGSVYLVPGKGFFKSTSAVGAAVGHGMTKSLKLFRLRLVG